LLVSAAEITAEAGQLRATWAVSNSGANATSGNYWYDAVVASVNDVYGDADDVLLLQQFRSGALPMGAEYSMSRLVAVPPEIGGSRHIFIVADAYRYVDEAGATANNVKLAATQDIDALRSHYDLVVAAVDAPDEATSGQAFSLTWTVRNFGDPLSAPGPRPIESAAGRWTDNVYLSRDQVFDPAQDVFVGQQAVGAAALATIAVGDETYGNTWQAACFQCPRG
jgi:hypothetical protein